MKFGHALAAILMALVGYSQNSNIDSLRAELVKAQGKEAEIKVLLELCWELRFINADTARVYGMKALEMSREAKLMALEAEALNYVGVTHEAQGNYTEALAYELPALELKKKLGDESKIAKSLNDVGVVYDEKGDYDKALEYYYEARRIFERLNDRSKIAMVISNIGIVLKAQKEYKKVVSSYHEALSIYSSLGNKFGIAACHANLGSVYFYLQAYDSSLFYSLMAAREFKEQNVLQFLAAALGNAGMAFDKTGKEKEATEYLTESLKLHESYDNKKEIAFFRIYLAGVDRRIGKVGEGFKNAETGLAMAQRIGAREQILEARRELAALHAASGNFRKAYEEHQRFAGVKDSLYQKEKSEQIAELQTRFETEKKENSIQLLKQENELKEFGLQRNRFITFSLVIILLGFLALGYLWRNRVKLRQQAELETTKTALKEVQLQAVITSQEDERRRFAADLHDGMGQMISALRLNLSHEPVLQNKVDEAVGILNDMNIEIRKIAFNLMPQVLISSGLSDALTEFSNRINRTGKVQVSVQSFNVDSTMSSQHKIALYRICQEWVNNILKYSGANRVSIQMVQHNQELVITLEDNGAGFDPVTLINGQGNGWKNINSRLGLIKGTIEIDSTPGREGTTVVITVPSEIAVLAA